MTANELQKVIDYISKNAEQHTMDAYDEQTGVWAGISAVYFNDLMKLLGDYPVEESEKTCGLNYEAEYNRLVEKNRETKDRVKGLEREKYILEHRLASAKGAIAMVEVIYGRQWSPAKLELIR